MPSAAPTAEHVTLDPQRQSRAREYAHARHRISLLSWILMTAYTLLWLLTGLSSAVRDGVNNLVGNEGLRVAAFCAVYFIPLWLLRLQLAYRYHAMAERYALGIPEGNWRRNILISRAAPAVLSLFAIEMLYSGLRDYPSTWWSQGGGNYIMGAVIAWYFNHIVAYLLLYRCGLSYGEYLSTKVSQLAQGSKAEISGTISTANDDGEQVGASATTKNGKRAVMLTESMDANFTTDEIETVMAHEGGHNISKVTRQSMIIVGMLVVGWIQLSLHLSLYALSQLKAIFDITAMSDLAGLPLLAFLLALFDVGLQLLLAAWSRWNERRADEYALKATNKPQPFISAMTKFANQSYYEANPDWLTKLMLTHPTYYERIAMAQRFANRQQTTDEQWTPA